MKQQPLIVLSLACLALSQLIGCAKTRDAGPYVEIPSGSFVQAWRANLELQNDRVASTHLVGDLVIVLTAKNTAYAVSASGGTVKWISQISAPGTKIGAPVLAGERVVFPSVDTLIVYSMAGRREREIPLERPIRSPLVADGDYVYVGFDYVGQGRLGRVSLTEAYVPVRWELMTRGAVSAAPAVFQGVIFVGSGDGNVYAVSEQRNSVWATPGNVFATGATITADVRADDTGVYVAAGDSKLYALDRGTGKILWQYYAGVSLRTSPLVTADTLYQFVPGKGLIALEKVAGAFNRQPKWILPAAVAALAEDQKYAYVRGGDNSVVAVDKKTGAPAFKTSRDDLKFFAANPTGGMVYASTEEGVLYGIKAVTSGGTVGQIVMANDQSGMTIQ